jgi:hypothetical protein
VIVLASTEDVYVLRSSWHQNGAGPEPLVAVIARNDEARSRAREALADIAGFPAEQWRTSWTPLSLGDWMIWVFPERVSRMSGSSWNFGGGPRGLTVRR